MGIVRNSIKINKIKNCVKYRDIIRVIYDFEVILKPKQVSLWQLQVVVWIIERMRVNFNKKWFFYWIVSKKESINGQDGIVLRIKRVLLVNLIILTYLAEYGNGIPKWITSFDQNWTQIEKSSKIWKLIRIFFFSFFFYVFVRKNKKFKMRS